VSVASAAPARAHAVQRREWFAAISSATTAASFTSRILPYEVPVSAVHEPRPRQDW
jgi:hypothetical protein